ncbi:MAG: hypothetical protein HZA61_08710 [Candidatus Eisenbacteria bacterium]|uniref:Uncharacterized protein n=1 Tax=Eiseniibacteriota bacterium TaxID=2212470 RepID=A0A933SGL5_UNCEI|nr:hypothetical protein [Candidatus Eisenbacteria bacterium]
MLRRLRSIALFLLAAASLAAVRAQAQDVTLDAPELTPVLAGQGKVRVTIEAGASGAPEGFSVWWMPRSRFEEYGSNWNNVPTWARRSASFVGEASLNTWGEQTQNFQLGGYSRLDVELGDLFDESGVLGAVADELSPAVEYVMTAFANAPQGTHAAFSAAVYSVTQVSGDNCTYTQGYWKTHPEAWPVSSLTLGTVSYTKTQLLAILAQPVQGNGLVSLARQLIAAKLNLAAGASPSAIASIITMADGLIAGRVVPPNGSGSRTTSSTSVITQALDDFNNGLSGPGHCGSTPARASTWGSLKTLHR